MDWSKTMHGITMVVLVWISYREMEKGKCVEGFWWLGLLAISAFSGGK